MPPTSHETPDERTIEDIRLAIYQGLARTGRVPDAGELVSIAGDPEVVDRTVATLADRRHLALDEAGAIVLAHPFATRSFGYSVMSEDTLWWGGCAWDSFALPHLVGAATEVLVATRCPGCGRPLAWAVGVENPPVGHEVAHFLVPAARMWDDVVHTCSNQLLFCGHACIDRWLVAHGHEEGHRMDLATLWQFAAGWYTGRLDRGYRRRDPGTAAEYLRSVGLTGPFWSA